MSFIRKHLHDYRYAHNNLRRRAVFRRITDLYFINFPPIVNLVASGDLPASVLSPSSSLTEAQQAMIADEQDDVREVSILSTLINTSSHCVFLASRPHLPPRLFQMGAMR